MKILAVDTTTNVLTVSVNEDKKPLAEYYIDHKRTHSQKLMPVIETVLSDTGIDISEIDLFAVSVGPGSFTGIRIGLTAARTLAQACGRKIAPVNTLTALAYNAAYTGGRVCATVDARNGNLYAAVYSFRGGKCKTVLEPCFISADELNEFLASKRGKTVAVGETELLSRDFVVTLEPRLDIPKASSVAAAAVDAGVYLDYNDADACYISKPQAQRELEEREKNK